MLAPLLLCGLVRGTAVFGNKEGKVGVLETAEDIELDDVAVQLAQQLVALPGVAATDKTRASIRAAVDFMRQASMLSCPLIKDAPNTLSKSTAVPPTNPSTAPPTNPPTATPTNPPTAPLPNPPIAAAGAAASNVKISSAGEALRAKLLKAEADKLKLFQVDSVPTDRKEYEQIMDEFLGVHRWWRVQTEPYDWEEAKDRKRLVVKRIPCKACEEWMRWMTARQYPGEAECGKHPMGIFRSDGAWGSFQGEWFVSFRDTVQNGGIFVNFQTGMVRGGGDTLGWKKVPKSLCPQQPNKWLCYYLPATGCAVPAPIPKCTNIRCLRKVLQRAGSANYYNAATSAGVKMSQQDFKKQSAKWLTGAHNEDPWAMAPKGTFGANPLTDVRNFTRPKYAEQWDRGMAVWYGMVFNSRTRSLVLHRTIGGWMKTEGKGWDWARPSVAMQIRRGDRVRNLTMAQLEVLCAAWQKNKGLMCRGGSCTDLGCAYPKETWWPGLTFDRYLARAQEQFDKLGGGNDIFIMTDDGAWIEEQKRSLPMAKKYNIYQMSGDPLGQDAFSHDDKRARETLAFWASVMLAQKCNAFVGSWGSAVSKLVYRYMCMHHADTYGVCPPAATMTVRL